MTTKCTRCGEVNPAEIHTCSPQSKALRLAVELEDAGVCQNLQAAAELRRLDALNGELVAALHEMVCLFQPYSWNSDEKRRAALRHANAVLEKAKEQT